MTPNSINNIASFVKYQRSRLKLTQEELAEKAGVGIRFIRDLEQGKETLRMDKVNQVLALFGHMATPSPEKIMDPYEILLHYINHAVKIRLKDRTEKFGIILGQVSENNLVTSWRFVSNNNVIGYQKTEDPKLEERIAHANIDAIENVTL
jgi:y4mF family transcriptional regulator